MRERHREAWARWRTLVSEQAASGRSVAAFCRDRCRNPVRARLVDQTAAYHWSSATAHVTGYDAAGLLDMDAWRKQYTVERWREVLRTSFAEESLAERLREATARGRPFGADEFVDELESKAERRLRPLAVGRPKKKEDASGGEQHCVQLRLGNGI